MWLEDAPQGFVWIIGSSLERSRDFRRMMCIVIQNRYTANGSLIFKTSVCTMEISKGFQYYIAVNAKNIHQCQYRKGIEDIVFTYHTQRNLHRWSALL